MRGEGRRHFDVCGARCLRRGHHLRCQDRRIVFFGQGKLCAEFDKPRRGGRMRRRLRCRVRPAKEVEMIHALRIEQPRTEELLHRIVCMRANFAVKLSGHWGSSVSIPSIAACAAIGTRTNPDAKPRLREAARKARILCGNSLKTAPVAKTFDEHHVAGDKTRPPDAWPDRHGQPHIASCSQTQVINESPMMITANSRLAASTREFFFIF